MSPRPYRLGQRQSANEPTRARIVGAARELLASPEGVSEFTVESVARQAGVARMTVYYQFGSRAGLLEGIYEDLAASGGMRDLPRAFQLPDPLQSLAEFISVFTRFWASERLTIRRLQVLTALDPELERVSRDQWRRQGLLSILRRLSEEKGLPSPEHVDQTVDVLHMLTSFQTFDQLAGAGRGPEEVAAMLQALALASLGLAGQSDRRR
jgi:AcrR family transcriptional regulator